MTVDRDTFPRQYARTQRFTLGEPRTFTVAGDGRRVIFLRSRSGGDPVNCLWEYDVTSDTERLVVDPLTLQTSSDSEDLSPEERSRRERLREAGGGITAYSVDDELAVVAFSLSGQLYVGDISSARMRSIPTPGPCFDPRLDPTGTRLAYVVQGELFAADIDPGSDVAPGRLIAGRSLFGEADTVAWGVADFIAAEEMNRHRGYWWSPDGRRLAVARVDESPVDRWTIADPSRPDLPAQTMRYPSAGSPNALVTLSLFDLSSGERRQIEWSTEDHPYLAEVRWDGPDSLVVTVQSRDQRTVVHARSSWTAPTLVPVVIDSSQTWVDLVPGTPRTLSTGAIVTVSDRSGVKRLIVDGHVVTPDDLDVRWVDSVLEDTIVFSAIDPRQPHTTSIWSWTSAGDELRRLTPGDGVHTCAVGGPTLLVRRSSLTLPRPSITVHTLDDPLAIVGNIGNHCEIPLVEPQVDFVRAGRRGIPCALVLPRHVPAGRRLPVLMDPYGGPHAQRVVDSYAAHCTSQWFADQGFAVVIADGRGTPGLGTDWERSVHHDLGSAALEDQVDALHALAERYPVLDTDRVAIRGWSFGGYLAALAVLRRPDVFHAAVAGAPVTDWRLYDTHYTERYLGDPRHDDRPYEHSSLIPLANRLSRPLLLIHGLADDNVVAAHTLHLSAALLAAGKPHEVLPLSGVTHMTPQANVAENLLLHQLDFLRRSLGLG